MSDQGFGKEFHLTSLKDFDYLKSHSNFMRCGCVSAYFKKTVSKEFVTRIGLSVSAKMGKANLRNKTKRIIREYFRCSEFKEMGIDILIIVSPKLYGQKKVQTDNTSSELWLKKSLNELFQKLGRVSLST